VALDQHLTSLYGVLRGDSRVDVAHNVGAEGLEHGGGWVVRHSDAVGAEEGGHDARQGRTRTQLEGGFATNVEVAYGRAQRGRDGVIELQGGGLDELAEL